MLVLSRRIGEQIVIGGKVSVTVVEIKGGQVRLGVTAPASIPVDRHEVHLRRQAGRETGSVQPPHWRAQPARG